MPPMEVVKMVMKSGFTMSLFADTYIGSSQFVNPLSRLGVYTAKVATRIAPRQSAHRPRNPGFASFGLGEEFFRFARIRDFQVCS